MEQWSYANSLCVVLQLEEHQLTVHTTGPRPCPFGCGEQVSSANTTAVILSLSLSFTHVITLQCISVVVRWRGPRPCPRHLPNSCYQTLLLPLLAGSCRQSSDEQHLGMHSNCVYLSTVTPPCQQTAQNAHTVCDPLVRPCGCGISVLLHCWKWKCCEVFIELLTCKHSCQVALCLAACCEWHNCVPWHVGYWLHSPTVTAICFLLYVAWWPINKLNILSDTFITHLVICTE